MTACVHMIRAGSRIEQPEYCDGDVVPGTDYCPTHLAMLDVLDGLDDAAFDRDRDERIERGDL